MNILRRRLHRPRRVIVSYDQGSRMHFKRLHHKLTWVHSIHVDGPFRDHPGIDYRMGRIEENSHEDFFL